MVEDAVKWAVENIAARSEAYRIAYDYYAGRHRLAFATEKFRNAFGALFSAFADNLCVAVVDAVADRLRVVGFASEDGNDEAADLAWQIWKANRMDRRSGEVHVEALCTGDAYVLIWPDANGMPTLYPQRAHLMVVHYDSETGAVDLAAKCWRLDDGRLRLNLYYPDRIEKYVTARASDGVMVSTAQFVELPDQPVVENPYGVVPVVHFANNAWGGEYGRSELGDVIPLQDALNKAVMDMLVAMEYVALPQRWATGLEVEIDEATGKPRVPFTPGVERIWAVGDPNVRFGQFDPANLSQFTAVQDSLRAEIARVSGTPLHYLMLEGSWPSGEAMKTAEARFLTKVRDRQQAFGNAWEDCMAIALSMLDVHDARLSTLWEDPAPASAREMAEVAVMKQQLGVSKRQILMELGYSPEQIEQMEQESEASSAELGEKLLTAFERGE